MKMSEFVKNMFTEAPKNKQMFFLLYKAAIELLTGFGNGQIDDLQLKKNNNIGNKGNGGKKEHYAWHVVDYYIKHFKNTYGPILMDRGVKKTCQGEFMEIAQSSKPITYIGLNSCIGVTNQHLSITVKNKIGVHLVIPLDDQKMQEIYVKRIDTLKKFCISSNLSICGKTDNDIDIHLEYIEAIFPEDSRPESIKWLLEKISNGKYSKNSNNSGIVTI